ncbi:hypothetical protein T552_00264 [Pneumocystis carinii B80]|uniref:GATA-type domain-containing protein n=1 Tax=Pneumocystis carinii (strain B80) TaxID=1408658 RepID=A0A0W4ZTC1_PNEC8|nr:hypothetical protein T552_00264 [Pneumocystis carinii B80]KTW31625.1 hypothetical protein T552_00264 [Pneumocystis carinii B80]
MNENEQNVGELGGISFFSKKNGYLRQKIANGFGLPIYNKPQKILEEDEDKYRTIEDSGVLMSSIYQSRQTLLQGLIFKKFSKDYSSKKQNNDIEKTNNKQKVSKIGNFTLDIELFSFPETVFYLVKYVTKGENTMPYKNIEEVEKPGSSNSKFQCKNENTYSSSDSDINGIKSENITNYTTFRPEIKYLDFFKKYFMEIFENDPLKVEKTNRMIERLKIVSLNPDFKEILHLIMTGKATIEQKTIFNLYMTSPQLQQIPSNYNEKITLSSIFQNKCLGNKDNNNNKKEKTKQKRNNNYKDAEIIFEFKENPGEKWILPKDIIIEKLNTKEPFEVLISFIYTEDSLCEQFQPITLKISSCSQKLWDFISKYSNDKKQVYESMSKILNGKRPEKLYFQYRITIADTKTFKNEPEERINIVSRNKKSILPQKRKMIDENDTISLSYTNNKSTSPITSKKTEKKHIVLPKDWNCNICNATETPLRRRGPDGPGTLCNACGMKWKGGKKIPISKEYKKIDKTYVDNKDQN